MGVLTTKKLCVEGSTLLLGVSIVMISSPQILAFSGPSMLAAYFPPDRALASGLRMSANPVSEAATEAGSQQVRQRLAVSIDEPLVVFDRMSPVTSQPGNAGKVTKLWDWPAIKKAVAGVWASKSFQASMKVAVAVSMLLLCSFLASKSMRETGNESTESDPQTDNNLTKALDSIRSSLAALGVAANKRFQKLLQRFQSPPEVTGVPMPFDMKSDNEGWGVCTLRSKRRLGRSSFVQYEFDLPVSDYFLPLDLGQQISLCCLDNSKKVAKGDFFPYNAESKKRLGSFAILAPNRTPPENEFAIGDDAANFVRVLKQDLKVGDEVALQPGKNRLEYRGQYLPVTDMVYIACGTGIVPVLDQVRMVLPSTSSSSVESVTVVWINESTRDFDMTAEQLEKEYHKYNTKLAVSCIVDDLTKGENAMSENSEIYEAVPEHIPGTMAVLSGPLPIMKKAIQYLQGRGYPLDCMCLL